MTKNNNHLHYWLAALYLKDIGPRTVMQLCQHFTSIEHVFSASAYELLTLGLSASQIQTILHPDWRSVEADLNWLESDHTHHIISLIDEHYPSLLKEIADPPIILYVTGDLSILNTRQIAIVGARNATPTGMNNAENFAHELAKSGFTITSGLALGIDGASHRGAISANGKTVAVLGAGLNHIYPRKHFALAKQISDHFGAVLSEFPLAMRPLAYHFPRRNRVIAGLSVGVIIIEAALKSGSLITARFALENSREVFAIPGSIHHPLARGCHHLIKQGAKLVETADDVLEEFGFCQYLSNPQSPNALPIPLSAAEQHILDKIDFEITSVDMIILQSGLTTSEVSSILLTLEMQGRIQIVSGGYVRTRF